VALVALVILPRAESPEALQKENPVLYEQVVDAYSNKTLLKSTNHSIQNQDFLEFYEKYENTIDPGVMYPKLMMRYLPAGLLGLLIAVFLAAYMSTIASQLNWGTSYIINDFYRRFIKRSADEKHYVLISRIGIILMVFFSLLLTKYVLTTISGAWIFIINASAGMGAVLILRWFWWRINAWSEISAMIAPLLIYPIAKYGFGMESPITLYPTVIGTTLVWIVVTYITEPVKHDVLVKFYKKVHPGGLGWKQFSKKFPDIKSDSGFGRLFLDWFCGVILVYASLFGIGKVIFADYLEGFLIILIGLIAALIIYFDLKKRGFESIAE
ncbi:MAG: sodium:proline symporter, partial [bacterium]